MHMSSEDLVQYMAQDFSMYLTDALSLDEVHPDGFFDPIVNVFGDRPDRESLVEVFNSANSAKQLASEINFCFEIDSVTIELAKKLMEFTIINNFGPKALD